MILKDGRLLCPLYWVYMWYAACISTILRAGAAAPLALKGRSRYKVEFRKQLLAFSLGSQFQPETVSLIIPIVVATVNSP